MNKEKVAEYMGNIDDRYLDEVFQHKGQHRRMIMNKKKPITIIAAAALAMLLTVSVAAATTFTGLVSKEEILDTAMTYVVMHDEDGGKLCNYILEGLSYGESSDETEVSLGLLGLRPVYNVKFKVGGYEYTVTVDAKTDVVLNCKKEVDPSWDEHLKNADYSEPRHPTPEDIEKWDDSRNVINVSQATLIAQDYTGLSRYGLYQCGEDALGNCSTKPIYGVDPQRFEFTTNHGGYRYTVVVNAETAEVMSCDIVSYGSDKGHTHEQDTEHISSYDATIIAAEYLRSVGFEDCAPSDISNSIPFTRRTDETIKKIAGIIVSGFDMSYLRGDFYTIYYFHDNNEIAEILFMDAYTGVIISTRTYTVEPSVLLPDQDVSIEAPEGMISEAAAKAVALSDSGIKDAYVYGFKITLDGEVYKLSYQSYAEGRTLKLYSYTINAQSGDIIETNVCDIIKDDRPPEEEIKNQTLNPEAPTGMISEADAAAIAFENSDIKEWCVRALRIDLADCVYKISYLFGYDDFSEETTGTWDFRTNTYEIDAVTGKILSFDALTHDDYIGEDRALAIAYELSGLSEDDVDRVTVDLESIARGYPQYSISLYSTWGMIYHYDLDAVSGCNHIFVR